MRLWLRTAILSLAASCLLASAACAVTPSSSIRRYQSVSSSARHDIPMWWLRHDGPRYVGTEVELRGMVDGTMVVDGERSFILRVGPEKLNILLRRAPFDCARGTAIWCVVRVLASGGKVPPDMQYVAGVRADQMMAYLREVEQERQAREAAINGLRNRYAWTTPWPTNNTQQETVAIAWMRTFNPALDDTSAHLISHAIFRAADTFHLDPRFILSLVAAESGFQVKAVSPVGAQGLGQLMPDTAARLGVKDAFDPEQNLFGAARFLNELLAMWQGTKEPLSLTLASYNAGPGAVKQYNGIPPYAETQSYVVYVLSLFRELGGSGV
ncbi:MAG: lytic transglycosylase domain-containing protein [Candidatus Xenobia bacterium]